MVSKVISKILALLNKGHRRSVKARKHVLASFFIKGGSILISFFLVPITLGYVNEELYGVWLTLSSVVAWFSFFDVGLGAGLRNRLAESWAKNDNEKARAFVSSTYAILVIIFSSLFLVFFIIYPFIDWSAVLNTSPDQVDNLQAVVFVTFSFFCLNFVLKLIYIVFLADQRPALKGLMNLIANFISLVAIYTLTKTTEGSLLYLALSISVAPLVVLIIANIYFYNKDYKAIKPSFKYIKSKYFRDVTSLGLRFFVIKISGLIIFSTDNIIITQLFGPAEVTPYNIAFKYFQLVLTVFAIISTPLWSAYTEAYAKGEISWITRTNRKLLKIWGFMLGGSLIMLIGANVFYSIWVPGVEVPFILSVCMWIFVSTRSFGDIFTAFINGVGKIQLQLSVAILGAIANIPLSIFFAKYLAMGSAGVIIASTICISFGPLLAPIQYRKIVKGTAKGIWNK